MRPGPLYNNNNIIIMSKYIGTNRNRNPPVEDVDSDEYEERDNDSPVVDQGKRDIRWSQRAKERREGTRRYRPTIVNCIPVPLSLSHNPLHTKTHQSSCFIHNPLHPNSWQFNIKKNKLYSHQFNYIFENARENLQPAFQHVQHSCCYR